ncbi:MULTISPECIES: hypothetical protein [Bradyrhizobium]|uniref:hypothetical protein n=1 Tax=Bradyrhizobium TaxID=374 RepID=UPI00222683D2|nr:MULTISPECIES: hypothetical protein [Bradyrhizobium]MCW2358852.1 hypothetical protein [Bradyrhizobium elkanii]MDI2057317.1 hypothetical protein [Bradyrhizobium sp. Mp19]
MTSKTRTCLALAALIVLIPSAMKAASAYDFNRIRDNEIRAICTGKYEGRDEELRRRFCESDDVDMRLLMGIQKIETGHTHIDIRPSPTAVAGAGALNDIIAVASAVNSTCRGSYGEKVLDAICTVRDHLYEALSDRGVCNGKKGQIGAQMTWHKCTNQSLQWQSEK